MKLISLIKNNQQVLILAIGYLLTAALGFGIGRVSSLDLKTPEIRVEEVFAAPLNNTQNLTTTQSNAEANNPVNVSNSCNGQIKGNISSKGERIYHMPGGSFYDRTAAEMCFATETEAQSAGFRKSGK
jgi:hypothetical protein